MKPVYVTVLTFVDGTHRLLARGQRLEVDSFGQWKAKWNVYGGGKRVQTIGQIITKLEVMTSEEAGTRFTLVLNNLEETDSPLKDKKAEEGRLLQLKKAMKA